MLTKKKKMWGTTTWLGAADVEMHQSPRVAGRSWNSGLQKLCDVEILVGLHWDAWKTPIPNEKYKAPWGHWLRSNFWPVKLGLKSWLMLSHRKGHPACFRFSCFFFLVFKLLFFSQTSFLSADNQNQRLPDTNLMKENSYKREMDGEGQNTGKSHLCEKCLCI